MQECKSVSTGNGSVTVTDENSVVAMTMTMLVADADDSAFSCFSLVLAKLLFQPSSTQRRRRWSANAFAGCYNVKNEVYSNTPTYAYTQTNEQAVYERSILFGMSASEKEDGKRILNIMQSERVHNHITHTHIHS